MGKVLPTRRLLTRPPLPRIYAAIEAGELARWDGRPERMLAYYRFPAEHGVNLGSAVSRFPRTASATVSTWLGTTIGRITSARVYRHNFGGRFVAITVQGTNGAKYHGRASWDNGQCVWLRKAKG